MTLIRIATLLLLSLMAAGCGAAGNAGAPAVPVPAPGGTAAPSVSTPEASDVGASPTVLATPSRSSATTSPSLTTPVDGACPEPSSGEITGDIPDAILSAGDDRFAAPADTAEWVVGGRAIHQTGGYLLRANEGSVPPVTAVRLTLTDSVPFSYASVFAIPMESWSAERNPEADFELLVRQPADPDDDSMTMTALCFALPAEPGEHVLEGRITFTEDRGRATYVWVLTVEE